ncbi:Hsp20/alpha crystallin family protein [Natronococcus sp. A-GB7]|uniref:Hsp20/alpha crystallin family protein n=1 Tax=Natronococcus sp. A-GB7 TaxID=3037649 RepID=UPI00241D7F55|nr:Hsp20/alpha crystallin family protein [Natronococcus sp. A-GB7]MDG5818141.1 Hsp20/alpha crystallin family protein [Natronococcus sp. A-GB7]
MAGRRNPFDNLEELFDRLNRQFEEATRTWESEQGEGFPFGAGTTTLDLADHDDEFVVTVDVPGYESEDLDSRLSGETLYISGEREHGTTDERDDSYLRRERELESFSRQLTLPEPVDADGIEARVNNGVLTIRLLKLEPGEGSHAIDID